MKKVQHMTPKELLYELMRQKEQFLSFKDKNEACEFAGGDDYDECLKAYDEEISDWEEIVNKQFLNMQLWK